MKCLNCQKEKSENSWQKGWDATLFCSLKCWDAFFQANKYKNKGKGHYRRIGINQKDLENMRKMNKT